MSDLVRELVRAFNINSHDHKIDTNLTVDGDGHISIEFSPAMSKCQCIDYLKDVRNKIIHSFYRNEHSAKISSFDLKCFPFSFTLSALKFNKQSFSYNLKIPVTQRELYNLESHLVHSMTKPIKGKIVGDISPEEFDKSKYIMRSRFANNKSAREFAEKFCAEVEKLGFSAQGLVVIHGPEVSINKEIFSNVQFVEKFVEKELWLTGRNFKFSSAEDDEIKEFKNSLIQFILLSTGIKVDCYDRSTYIGGDEDIILIPVVKDNSQSGFSYLTGEQAGAINQAFGSKVLNGVTKCISDKLPVASPEKTKGIYGIDFYNKDISNCVINTLFERAVVNKFGKGYRLEVQPTPKLLRLYEKTIEMGLLQKLRLMFLSGREGGEPSHFAGMQTGQQSGANSQFVRLKLTKQQPSTSAGASSWSVTTEPVQGIFGEEQMTTQFRSFNVSGSAEPPFSLDFLRGASNVPGTIRTIPFKATSTHVQPVIGSRHVSRIIISGKVRETGDQSRPKLKLIKRGGLLPSAGTSTDSNVSGTSDKETGDEQQYQQQSGVGSCRPPQDPNRASISSSSTMSSSDGSAHIPAANQGLRQKQSEQPSSSSQNREQRDNSSQFSPALLDIVGTFIGQLGCAFFRRFSPTNSPGSTPPTSPIHGRTHNLSKRGVFNYTNQMEIQKDDQYQSGNPSSSITYPQQERYQSPEVEEGNRSRSIEQG